MNNFNAQIKPALTFNQQLDHLINDKGLIVNNYDNALSILKHENYYRLSGYMIDFLDKKRLFLRKSHTSKWRARFVSSRPVTFQYPLHLSESFGIPIHSVFIDEFLLYALFINTSEFHPSSMYLSSSQIS